MAITPLSLHPALKAWYNAGLQYVYLDDAMLESFTTPATQESKEAFVSAPTAQPAFYTNKAGSHVKPQQSVPAHRQTKSQAQAQSPVQAQSQQRAQQHAQQQNTTTHYGIPEQNNQDISAKAYSRRQRYIRPYGEQPEAEQSAYSERNVASAAEAGQSAYSGQQQDQSPEAHNEHNAPQSHNAHQATSEPPHMWPQAWQDLLARTPVHFPLLWTYWALGEDLGGSPNAERRDLLKQLLGLLAMPRGSHAFWPIALPNEAGQLIENTPIFLAGIEYLCPRICIVMGSKVLRCILPQQKIGPFQQIRYGTQRLIVLPDMDMLLMDPKRLQAVAAYLRPTLAPFAR